MMGQIRLEGMEFYAYHGCYKEEQTNGNWFIVDVAFDVDITIAAISDSLDDTIDYQEAYNIVKREMEEPSQLLEHVAMRIKNSINAELNGAENIVVKISKLTPPMGGKVAASAVIV